MEKKLYIPQKVYTFISGINLDEISRNTFTTVFNDQYPL